MRLALVLRLSIERSLSARRTQKFDFRTGDESAQPGVIFALPFCAVPVCCGSIAYEAAPERSKGFPFVRYQKYEVEEL